MSHRNIRNLTAVLSLAALAGCSQANAERAAALAADSARAQGASTAEITRRADRARTAITRTLITGTTIMLASVTDVTSQKDEVGKPFTARTVSAVLSSAGDTVIPVGAELSGQVTALESAGSPGDTGRLMVALNTLRIGGQDYPVATRIVSMGTRTVARGITVDDAAKVGVGAAAGAIAGRLIGRNRTGAVAGAVVGGAAGTVYANRTKDHDIVLSPGSRMEVALNGPFTRTMASR
jgi:hypothetical protein